MSENTSKLIADLQIKMNEMSENVANIKQQVNAHTIDIRRCLKANTQIPPGIGCKFAFDSNGLILKTIPLSPSDIPNIEIDSIKELREILNGKMSKSEFEKLKIISSNNSIKKSDEIVMTGCKVNIDKNGFVVSISDLLPEDIPVIEMEGINGLIDRLKLIESTIESNHKKEDESFLVNPNTGCKISYDSKGRVIKSESLSMDDIPREIIRRLNEIESTNVDKASQSSITEIISKLNKKLDSNPSIQSGTYTKVTVDKNGLVIKGEKLVRSDLPSFSIQDINGLQSALRNKAEQSDITNIYNTLESLSSFVNKIGDINALRISLDHKAEQLELESLKLNLSTIQDTVNQIMINIPYDTINQCISNLEKEINNLSGRIAVLERKLNDNL